MFSFLISLAALVVGYLLYSRFVERVFSPDDRPTPAISRADGVDFVALPTWKVFMIQFLNIAGTGPIFGAIMGAWYGPWAYFWIVLGSIFAGGVHDYLSGMLSVRHGGAGMPEIVGHYMGAFAQKAMLVFAVLLLLLVGVVFVYSPAAILSTLFGTKLMWVAVIFVYYIIATMLPIDKLIGRIYPFFAASLLFMAVALMAVLLLRMPALPEWWTPLTVAPADTAFAGVDAFLQANSLFPCMFITIACGALSGFHATQSPLMARCIKSERLGRPVFYGAMIAEGVVALVWATVSMWFFYYGGWREVVPADAVEAFLAQTAGGKTLVQYFDAPLVVKYMCSGWLGIFGGILALLGVVAAPITSGDTAFRSARLIIAETLGLEQRGIRHRMAVCLPLFAVAVGVLAWQTASPDGFNTVWQYFGWSNQTLAVFTLWTATLFLAHRDIARRAEAGKPARGIWWDCRCQITFYPAAFMTAVCLQFLMGSPIAFNLAPELCYWLVPVSWIGVLIAFESWFHHSEVKYRNKLADEQLAERSRQS